MLSYEARLSRLARYSLEFRTMSGDHIKSFNVIRGIDRVNAERLFTPAAKV